MLFENASNELLTFFFLPENRTIALEKSHSQQHTEIEQHRSLAKTIRRGKVEKKNGTKRRDRRQQIITITKHLLKQHLARYNIDVVPAHWEFNIQDVT